MLAFQDALAMFFIKKNLLSKIFKKVNASSFHPISKIFSSSHSEISNIREKYFFCFISYFDINIVPFLKNENILLVFPHDDSNNDINMTFIDSYSAQQNLSAALRTEIVTYITHGICQSLHRTAEKALEEQKEDGQIETENKIFMGGVFSNRNPVSNTPRTLRNDIRYKSTHLRLPNIFSTRTLYC